MNRYVWSPCMLHKGSTRVCAACTERVVSIALGQAQPSSPGCTAVRRTQNWPERRPSPTVPGCEGAWRAGLSRPRTAHPMQRRPPEMLGLHAAEGSAFQPCTWLLLCITTAPSRGRRPADGAAGRALSASRAEADCCLSSRTLHEQAGLQAYR